MEKSKVEKSKEDELCPDEEAISAEEEVKKVVGESRPCHYVDFSSSPPRRNPQKLFGDKGHKKMGTIESISTEKA